MSQAPANPPPPPPAPPTRPADALPEADPAQQSLSDALRLSFGLLRLVMIVLIVGYLFSGFYQVGQQESAVVTRFGKIVEDREGNTAKERGLHFGWPYPIDQVVKVPTNDRSLSLNRAFVYEGEGTPGPLNPERDGSLITGDVNLVHARFQVLYAITDPEDFLRNIGDPAGVTEIEVEVSTGAETERVVIERTGLMAAQELVRNFAEQGIVHAVGSVTADEVLAGRFSGGQAQRLAQEKLDELAVGITIRNISFDTGAAEMPLAVRDAYGLVSQAEAQKSTVINEAESERTQLLGEAGGKAALPVAGNDGPLVRLVKEYELATTLGDTARLAELDTRLRAVFRGLAVPTDAGTVDIGGETATVINTALIAKSQISERIKTEAETVLELREAFARDPQLFKERRWQYVAREVFGEDSGIELMYVPSGQRLLLEMNRDPAITRTKGRARLDAEQERARDGG
ncbi:MAG: SPFH domain-containing protein [Planctomycetota bacterium]